MLPGSGAPITLIHWSFGQLASLVGAPAAYLRQLPAPLAGINLQYGLTSHRAEQVKTLEIEDGRVELRAVSGPDYLTRLAPIVGGSATDDAALLASIVRSWTEASVFPEQLSNTSDNMTGVARPQQSRTSHASSAQDWTGLAPRSDGLFVAWSSAGRSQ